MWVVVAAWWAAQEAVPVRTGVVEARRVQQSASLVGTARAWRRSVVAGEVEGRVARMRVDEGETVRDGAPLAELDSELLRVQVRAAEAARAAADARHRQSTARLERLRKLSETKIVSEDELETEMRREEELGHERARAAAEAERLSMTLTKKIVRAPFDGVVVAKRTEVGQWLSPGGAVAEIADLSRVQVRVELPERYAAAARRELPVEIRADALPERLFKGTIVALVPSADDLARSFPLRIEVANPDVALKDGMLCRAEVPLEGERDALVVPRDALVARGNASFLVLVEEGKARSLAVKLGRAYGDAVEVVGDTLRAGQVVVTRGNERLRDGQPVKSE
jgi:RND family efflux transporter MFP subunit